MKGLSWLSRLAGGLVRLEGRKFSSLKRCQDDYFLTPSKGESALYIHIPFCRQPCPYCSFHRYQFREDIARRYFRNLRTEIDLYLDRGFHFAHIYLGGGTPTVMMDELVSLLSHLKSRLGGPVISLETNPSDITPENIALLKELGVGRLSVGVQSFNDRLLKAMGRTSHTGVEAQEKVRLAQGNFETLNIDILYNLPDQRPEVLRSDIVMVRELEVDQVTFYPLMPPLNRGEPLPPSLKPDNRREGLFYKMILEEMYDGGYRPSTAWCFSRGRRMIDEYIVDYGDYIAVGCGAVGFFGGVLYANTFSLDRYSQMLESGGLPVALFRGLSRSEASRYRLLTTLFGMGIRGDGFRRRFGDSPSNGIQSLVALLQFMGVVEGDGEELRVTGEGMMVVSRMMREFFSALNRLREYCLRYGI